VFGKGSKKNLWQGGGVSPTTIEKIENFRRNYDKGKNGKKIKNRIKGFIQIGWEGGRPWIGDVIDFPAPLVPLLRSRGRLRGGKKKV